MIYRSKELWVDRIFLTLCGQWSHNRILCEQFSQQHSALMCDGHKKRRERQHMRKWIDFRKIDVSPSKSNENENWLHWCGWKSNNLDTSTSLQFKFNLKRKGTIIEYESNGHGYVVDIFWPKFCAFCARNLDAFHLATIEFCTAVGAQFVTHSSHC